MSSSGTLDYLFNKKKVDRILVDVDETKALLTSIRAKADDIRAEKKLLEALLSQVQASWTGQSANAMIALLEKAISEQEAIATELETNTAAMQSTIQHLVDTDETIAEAIRMSGTGGNG